MIIKEPMHDIYSLFGSFKMMLNEMLLLSVDMQRILLYNKIK